MAEIIKKIANKSKKFPTLYLFLLILSLFVFSSDSFITINRYSDLVFKFETYIESNPISATGYTIDFNSNLLNINELKQISNVHCSDFNDYSVCENYSDNLVNIRDMLYSPKSSLASLALNNPMFELDANLGIFNNKLPQILDKKVKKVAYTTLTAYNSDYTQCDGSPCITATGFNLCEHGIEDSIAANFLPFGATVKIPDIFGDKTFIVRDRMNSRYYNRIDVWMKDKSDARSFGIKRAMIEILE